MEGGSNDWREDGGRKEGRKQLVKDAERKEEEDNKRRKGVRETWKIKASRKEERVKGVWEQRLHGGRMD